MTVTEHEHVTVKILTRDEARQELQQLIACSGMDRDELDQRAAVHDLDAQQRALLTDIEGLEWMLRDCDRD